eukprot:CAMPEP_0118929482 /NCGR_PEP_ID=MMETSP1169-20130426/6468_1 /TAXON_ID=36882 /ORGANISM="Pyramimonas obovata, Strain CCMP722" /LENGTH=70 /DNA_ID=CAMNT_0006871681 /DNA_START=699 /DNA_END=911 /DNA_ORIENTATION=+
MAFVTACERIPTGQHIMQSTRECAEGTVCSILSRYTCLAANRSTASRWIQADATVTILENSSVMLSSEGR